jgi:hypothetical protein
LGTHGSEQDRRRRRQINELDEPQTDGSVGRGRHIWSREYKMVAGTGVNFWKHVTKGSESVFFFCNFVLSLQWGMIHMKKFKARFWQQAMHMI